MPTMYGFPAWLLAAVAVSLPLVSVAMVLWLQRHPGNLAPDNYWRRDILRIPAVKAVLRWRPFQFLMQLPFVIIFALIIVIGFLGTQVAYMNLAPIITWTIWWAGLIVAVLFLGKAWCLVCPWNAIAQWLQRKSFWHKKQTSLSLNLRWPRYLRNIYPSLFLFMVLTWLELGFGITRSPWATAGLGLLILLLTVAPAFYFEKKPFCRYACLVGQISGLYSLAGTLELRSRDKAVCQGCKTKDCLRGNQHGYGCPVYEYPGTMDQTTYCILCTECIKTCPKDNIALNFRSFAANLVRDRRPRVDESIMILAIVALTSFHGITMTSIWNHVTGALKIVSPPGDLGVIVSFSLGMMLVLVTAILVYLLFSWIAQLAAGRSAIPFSRLFLTYAFALLPVAFFFHLAHNMHHLFSEGQNVVTVISDPLGWGWNLFGTAGWQVGHILPMPAIQYLQGLLVIVGQGVAVYVAFALSRHLLEGSKASRYSLVPVIASTILFSLVNLWLLSLPMQMRTAM